MLASRVVRQMAAGANKDPERLRKESQRVFLGITGMIGLTTLVYYAGYTAEGKRPNKNYNEIKTMDQLSLDNDEAIIKEVAVIE